VHSGQRASTLSRSVLRAWPVLVAVAILGTAALFAFEGAAIWELLNLRYFAHRIGVQFERLLPITVPTMLGLFAILVLELRFPAKPQPFWTRDRCLDIVWVLLFGPLVVLTAFWFDAGMSWLFEHPLAGLRFVNLGDHLPEALVVVLCFVFGDLLAWCYHYLKHRSSLLWRFHAVHHSTDDLNMFSDQRIHVAEHLINRTIVTLPFFMIGGNAANVVFWFVLARVWYVRFLHANIRTNLGPLRYVLVTPQYHRMHHSIEPQDRDHNFGAVLSIWDRLFGTVINDHERYPTTGIPDPHFPRPKSRVPLALLRTFVAQLVYPFRPTRVAAPTAAAAAPALTQS
jgi:sterol desaturase/sphingolipid hydroxylase (fatty acid hydroxylase superfamily)